MVATAHASPPQQMALDIALPPKASLANFEAGGNADALAHVRLWAGSAQAIGSPVPSYLWGASGSGKTHLLDAASAALQGRGLAVGRMDATRTEPGEFEPQWSAIVLDDVQAYSAVQQRAAFQWIVQAMSPASGTPRAVLAAGAVPPADLPLRDDLRSRLGWGHVFQLQPPDEPTRRAILRAQAHARGIRLGDDVLDYVLARFSRDLSHLSELLARLDAYALRTRRPLSIALLRDMMAHEPSGTHP